MITALREAFRDQMRGSACQDALTHAEFFVQDPPSPSLDPCFHYLPPIRSRFDLQVLNESRRLVHFIKTDKCLHSVSDGRRCDCLLLTTDQACFVEFKAPDSDKTSAGNLRYALAADCVEQLELTIKDFVTRKIIPPNALVFAYACVGRSPQYPYPGADFLQLQVAFNNRFAGLPIRVRLLVESTVLINKNPVSAR